MQDQETITRPIPETTSDREQLLAELQRHHAALHASKLHRDSPLVNLDMTIPQLRVISLLAESRSMRMSGIASGLGITLSGSTHLLDKLVRAGYVSRGEDPDDRRAVCCTLTSAGQELAERLRQSFPFGRPEVLDQLTDDELAVVVRAMAIIHRVTDDFQDNDTSKEQA